MSLKGRIETHYSNLLTEASLISAIRELEAVIKLESRVLEAILNTSEPSSQWSHKQIIGHLIDSASNNLQRFTRAQIPTHLEHGALIIDGYAQDDWVQIGDYVNRNAHDIVTLWVALNQHILHMMRNVNAASLQTNIVISGGVPVTLEAVMIDYVGHLKHHLGQIFA